MSIHSTTSTPALVLAALALAVGAAGCGSDDEAAPSAATPAASQATQLPAGLPGRWSRRMTRADLKRPEGYPQEGAGQSAPPPGRPQPLVPEGHPPAPPAIPHPPG